MPSIITPVGLGKLCVPHYDAAPHIMEMEAELLKLARGDYRRLMLSIPKRHGKSEMANLFIAWLLLSRPEMRILRVMEVSDTADMEALHVLKALEQWGPKLCGLELDRRQRAKSHFKTSLGGELRSLGMSGSAESWTFDWIILDDILVDPFAVRSPNRREQIYRDMQQKFLSRVSPTGITKFLFIGSRRHPDDPQGRLLERDEAEKVPDYDRWHYHHRPAIIDEGKPTERALWPTSKEFGLDSLRRLRDQKISDGVAWEWFCDMQNDPIASPDMLAFDPTWFDKGKVFYDFPAEALPVPKFRVMATDPSMGAGNELNDFFASVYLHIADDGTVFVDDSFIAVCKPDYMVPMVTGLVARHQNMDVSFWEANSGGLYAAELVKRECDRLGLRFPVAFKTYGASDEKISRITLNLFEILQSGKLRIRDTPMNRILYRQLRGFPTEKMDAVDALATAVICLKELLK